MKIPNFYSSHKPKNSADYLDDLKKAFDVPSDNQLAKLLDMPRERVSMYRTHKREFDLLTSAGVASLLEIDLQEMWFGIEACRAKREKEREVWLWLAQQAKKSRAAAVLVSTAFVSGFASLPGQAHAALQCILCKVGEISRKATSSLDRMCRLHRPPDPLVITDR